MLCVIKKTTKQSIIVTILQDCWCDNIVLNVLTPTADECDDIRDSLYEELENFVRRREGRKIF
jgi:hypothetical protein